MRPCAAAQPFPRKHGRPSASGNPRPSWCGALPHMSGVSVPQTQSRTAFCTAKRLMRPCRLAKPRCFLCRSREKANSRSTNSDTAFCLCGLAGSLSPGFFCATGAKKRIAAARTLESLFVYAAIIAQQSGCMQARRADKAVNRRLRFRFSAARGAREQNTLKKC